MTFISQVYFNNSDNPNTKRTLTIHMKKGNNLVRKGLKKRIQRMVLIVWYGLK
jgi:hypothetical protein